MTPTQLRSLIRKYGHYGLLLVATYFGLEYVWRRRGYILFAGLLISGLVMFLFCARTTQRRDTLRRVSSSSALPSLLPKVVKPSVENDRLQETLQVMESNNRWRIERWKSHQEVEAGEYVRFVCNDRLVQTIHAQEIGGTSVELGKPAFATRFPLIVLRPCPEVGEPETICLYTLKQGRLISMGWIDGGENGGPIFRDYDGDGQPEWVFDDYCWYRYYGAGPKYYLIYKELGNGKLKLWKRERNVHRHRLPGRLGLASWDT